MKKIIDPSHEEFDLASIILLAEDQPERFTKTELRVTKYWKIVTKSRKPTILSKEEIEFLTFIKKYVEMEEENK